MDRNLPVALLHNEAVGEAYPNPALGVQGRFRVEVGRNADYAGPEGKIRSLTEGSSMNVEDVSTGMYVLQLFEESGLTTGERVSIR